MALKASEGSDNVTEMGDLASTDKPPIATGSITDKGKLVWRAQPEYNDFMNRLKLIHAMLGGTYELRKLCEFSTSNEYLPAEKEEDEDSYKARVNRTTLFNAFLRTRQKLVGEVFGKDVTLSEDMSDAEKEWMEDIDLKGNDINTFASTVFAQALSDGVTYILADYPQVEMLRTTDNKLLFFAKEIGKFMPFTKAVEKQKGWRPYLVHIKAEQVIGIRTKIVNGEEVILQIRIHETVVEPDGPYAVKDVEKIRVLEPGRYELWRRPSKAATVWELESSGLTSLDYVPLVQMKFGEKTNALAVVPPMDDLAYLNLNHFQSTSDQKNILHYARMVVWFGKCLDKNENDKIVFGANKLVHSDNEASDLKAVEHNGHAINSGRNDIKDTENQMAMFGLTFMAPQTRTVTATEKTLDANENDSSLLNWTRIAEDGFNTSIQYMNEIIGLPKEKSGTLIFNKEFRNFLRAEDSLIILNAVERNLLPVELMVKEFKRRGIISDEWDLVELKSLLEAQVRDRQDIGGLAFNNTGKQLSSPDETEDDEDETS